MMNFDGAELLDDSVSITIKPSRWQRFWTRVFFGSVWTDL